jgi:hypothetical protein
MIYSGQAVLPSIHSFKGSKAWWRGFDCATWLHKAKELPKEGFKLEVERYLSGKETEPWEIMYFKLYKPIEGRGESDSHGRHDAAPRSSSASVFVLQADAAAEPRSLQSPRTWPPSGRTEPCLLARF